MCWCMKVTCPLLLNLSSRITSDIADFISRAIMIPSTNLNISKPNKELHTDIEDEPKGMAIKNIDSPSYEVPSTPIKPVITTPINIQPVLKLKKNTKYNDNSFSSDTQHPFEALQKWKESLRNSVKRKKDIQNVDMTERPLPIPVENEFYYMKVDRSKAETLLEGQPDGTFILRPSSQPNHLYTVTLTYQGRIYNIGCRQRQDGRLALGFFKATEPNFQTIHDLIEYYYNEKLILLVNGEKVGSTVLKKLHP